MRRAKIVATIGPASDSEQVLESLIKAGMNVARLNFSHGTHEQHAARVAAIRRVSKKLETPIGILQFAGPNPYWATGITASLVDEEVCLYATG
jgi:pyruvate kinase